MVLEKADLVDCRLGVGCRRVGHRLDADRRVSADGHRADHDLTRLAPIDISPGADGRHARGYRASQPGGKAGLEIRSRLSSCVNKVNGLAWGRPMPKLAQLPANDRAPDTADANARRVPRLQPRYFAFLSYSHKDKALAD